MAERTRLVWVDNVKVIAIFFVAVGHYIMGLESGGIIGKTALYTWFISLIYMFHVPLFFICSGFLYQRYTKIDSPKAYGKNLLKKLLAFGVPYFVFSTATYLMKVVFSSEVNSQNKISLLKTLFVRPEAPYWFLYALFLLFMVTPLMKSKKGAFAEIAVALVLYSAAEFIGFSFLPELPALVAKYIFYRMIWFVLGIVLAYGNAEKYFTKKAGGLFVLFLIAGTLYIRYRLSFPYDTLLLGILACTGVIGFIGKCYEKNKQTRVFGFLAKYTMPIFLMHTIFAAGVRILLIKIGITNAPVHLICGFIASFALPVAAAMIMEKIKLDFLYSPTKYIKIK